MSSPLLLLALGAETRQGVRTRRPSKNTPPPRVGGTTEAADEHVWRTPGACRRRQRVAERGYAGIVKEVNGRRVTR